MLCLPLVKYLLAGPFPAVRNEVWEHLTFGPNVLGKPYIIYDAITCRYLVHVFPGEDGNKTKIMDTCIHVPPARYIMLCTPVSTTSRSTHIIEYYVTLLAPAAGPAFFFRQLKDAPISGACARLLERVCKACDSPRILPRGARKSQVTHVLPAVLFCSSCSGVAACCR